MTRIKPFADADPMIALYERTVRHEPTGDEYARRLVQDTSQNSGVVARSSQYLVRCLVRRMAAEAGVDVITGVTPAERPATPRAKAEYGCQADAGSRIGVRLKKQPIQDHQRRQADPASRPSIRAESGCR